MLQKNKRHMTVFYIVMVCHAKLPDERFIALRYNLQPVKLDRTGCNRNWTITV